MAARGEIGGIESLQAKNSFNYAENRPGMTPKLVLP
jgi:hypothetical protein